MGGMPGMPGVPPEMMSKLMSDPEMMAAMQNPKVLPRTMAPLIRSNHGGGGGFPDEGSPVSSDT